MKTTLYTQLYNINDEDKRRCPIGAINLESGAKKFKINNDNKIDKSWDMFSTPTTLSELTELIKKNHYCIYNPAIKQEAFTFINLNSKDEGFRISIPNKEVDNTYFGANKTWKIQYNPRDYIYNWNYNDTTIFTMADPEVTETDGEYSGFPSLYIKWNKREVNVFNWFTYSDSTKLLVIGEQTTPNLNIRAYYGDNKYMALYVPKSSNKIYASNIDDSAFLKWQYHEGKFILGKVNITNQNGSLFYTGSKYINLKYNDNINKYEISTTNLKDNFDKPKDPTETVVVCPNNDWDDSQDIDDIYDYIDNKKGPLANESQSKASMYQPFFKVDDYYKSIRYYYNPTTAYAAIL